MASSKKLEGYELFRSWGSPTRIVAPMVDQSELAWRMLSRKYEADLCYSPMFHSYVFAKDLQYRTEALQTCSADRPLIIQFCGNDPDTIVKAGKLAEDYCDAIDINLGCPQMIARRGNYGAFLEDKWDIIESVVKKCHQELNVPVTCKIRVFDDVKKSVEYAKMIEKAGCQLLTVHGRTKQMKGPKTGLASWKHIKAIKEAVKIPVFANGNIQYKEDYLRCMKETGVDGVMIAEGSLRNPCLFSGLNPIVWDISLEYLDLVNKYPCPTSYVRGHIFKMCHHALKEHHEARSAIATAKSIADIRQSVLLLKKICTETCKGVSTDQKLPFPHWICQPYVRPPEKSDNNSILDMVDVPDDQNNNETSKLSKKQMKKLMKRKHAPDVDKLSLEEKASKLLAFKQKKIHDKVVYAKCVQCGNPAGQKCVFLSCKPCCKRRRSQVQNISCELHKAHQRRSKVEQVVLVGVEN